MESRCRYGKQEAVIITHRVQQAAFAIEKPVKDFHVSLFGGILITQAINNDDQMSIAIIGTVCTIFRHPIDFYVGTVDTDAVSSSVLPWARARCCTMAIHRTSHATDTGR
jgi:hypothetical protein